MRQPTTPRHVSWLHLLLALLVLGFGGVFGALATGILVPVESGRGGTADDSISGIRLMAGGVAALSLFMSAFLAATGLRGRQPGADDERGRIAESWSVADGGSITTYRQAIGRGLVNLGASAAASLMVIGFVVGGLLSGTMGMVVVAGLMGLLIVPFTIKGIVQFLFDPVVLELGRFGIRLRGHRRVPWADVEALRIEDYPTRGARRVQVDPASGPSRRRLGLALRHDAGRFSLMSAMTGGAYGRIGITELELPVRIEEVLERARAYYPELEVEGSPIGTTTPATPDPRAFGPERADAEPVRWQGATVVPALVRRRLRDAALNLPSQLGGLVVVAIGLVSSGAGEALPLVLGALALVIGGLHVVTSGIGTFRAARAARDRRYTLTETFLVTQSGRQRHERRLASLPPLVLSMERDGIGTVSFGLPSPAIPEWIRRLSPLPQRRTGLLLESIPNAEHVFGLLQAATAAGAAATEEPTAGLHAAPEPLEPTLLAARPWTVRRFGAWIPWWGGLPFFVIGIIAVIVTLSTRQTGAIFVTVLFELVFVGIGAWILWSNLSVAFTRRRLAESGTVVMARVVGLADANAEINGEDQWAVRYEYEAGGRTQTGESPFMSQASALRWAAGDRVSITYDPSRPEVSIWLGGDPMPGS